MECNLDFVTCVSISHGAVESPTERWTCRESWIQERVSFPGGLAGRAQAGYPVVIRKKGVCMADETVAPEAKALARSMGEKAENLFLTRQLMCSEAVVSVLNQALGAGVPDEVVIRMASALPIGMGESGCTCGALSGGVLALGLFLGRDAPAAADKRGALPAANALHNRFKQAFGSSCCRVLTKNVKHDSRLHFQHCAKLTGLAAELAALIILEKRPELIGGIDNGYVQTRDTWLAAKLRRLVGRKAG